MILEEVYGPDAGSSGTGMPKESMYKQGWLDLVAERVVYEFDLPEKYTSWEDMEAVSYAFAIHHEILHREHRGTYKPMEPDVNPHSPDAPWLPVYIFLDDCRETPDGAYRSYTVEQTIRYLKSLHHSGQQAEWLSLDNDLGYDPKVGGPLQEGHKVLTWMLNFMAQNPDYRPPKQIFAHTSNSVARDRMNSDIQLIMNFPWERIS